MESQLRACCAKCIHIASNQIFRVFFSKHQVGNVKKYGWVHRLGTYEFKRMIRIFYEIGGDNLNSEVCSFT